MRTKILFTLLSLLQFSLYAQEKNPMPALPASLPINSVNNGRFENIS